MNRTDIINLLIDRFGYKFYLEIGVRNPNHNFNKIVCKYKYGVDIKDVGLKPSQWFHGTSDNFFEKGILGKLKDNWDCIFIDGDHRYKQVLKDFQNSYTRLHGNGVIILHDVNPANKESQGPIKKSGDWSGEVWKLWHHLKTFLALDMFTVDCDYGVGIIRKNQSVAEKDVMNFLPQEGLKEITYGWFENHKENVLDLIETKAEFIIDRMGVR